MLLPVVSRLDNRITQDGAKLIVKLATRLIIEVPPPPLHRRGAFLRMHSCGFTTIFQKLDRRGTRIQYLLHTTKDSKKRSAQFLKICYCSRRRGGGRCGASLCVPPRLRAVAISLQFVPVGCSRITFPSFRRPGALFVVFRISPQARRAPKKTFFQNEHI